MFQDTRPADLDDGGEVDRWAQFRVSHTQERLALLRQLRDGNVPIILNGPDGGAVSSSLWTVDAARDLLYFSIDAGSPQVLSMAEADETVAVAYLESVKLQFGLHGLLVVRGAQASTLQTRLPNEIYRFQRRNAYRVRTQGRVDPLAHFEHPQIPGKQLALRVMDVSIGGCALWLPADQPDVQPGSRIGQITLDLDADTRFTGAVQVQHASTPGPTARGSRLGCEWSSLPGGSERTLQRWIDQAQKRRRLLSLS